MWVRSDWDGDEVLLVYSTTRGSNEAAEFSQRVNEHQTDEHSRMKKCSRVCLTSSPIIHLLSDVSPVSQTSWVVSIVCPTLLFQKVANSCLFRDCESINRRLRAGPYTFRTHSSRYRSGSDKTQHPASTITRFVTPSYGTSHIFRALGSSSYG